MIDPMIRHAITKRCCPRCIAPVVLKTDDSGEYIECTHNPGHRYALAAIWDCPTQQRIDILQREGETVVRGVRQGQDTSRRPVDDMAELYGL